jgi:Arc/MetJ-type ribon-helix-helix transcriptional regulator
MAAKPENRVALVVGSDLIQRIDQWRADQPGLSPSRSAVLRQALEEFLARKEQKRETAQETAA